MTWSALGPGRGERGWRFHLTSTSDVGGDELLGDAGVVAHAATTTTLEIRHNGDPVLRMEGAHCVIFGGAEKLRRLAECLDTAEVAIQEAHLARIQAQNPGIDIDAVRRSWERTALASEGQRRAEEGAVTGELIEMLNRLGPSR